VKARSLASVASAVGGRLLGDDVALTSVAIDSRLVAPGSLFVALPGARADGHDFIPDAFARGAAAVLVRDRSASPHGPAVAVADTGTALIALAADERDRFDGVVVGISGANGKTSTKDMASTVCAAGRRTHASPGSFNNEIGLPMTILGAPQDAEVMVAELGARHVGDAAALCAIARPRIVVVTNVGVAHMEVFGSWEAIVAASAEPVDAVEPDGVAILCADDPVVAGYATRCRGTVRTYGLASGVDVGAVGVELDGDGRASFDVVADGERARVTLAVAGEHMVANALAAVAVGLEVGIPLEDAARAIARAGVSRWRMETFRTADGIRVVNDAYNANPESMAAALKAARWMAGDHRLIAVLGPMAELGAIAADEHERIGELAARLRVDRLITVGHEAKTIAAAGVREGVPPDDVASYDDRDAALADIVAHAGSGDLVLFKASRVAGLETLAEALR
jgi:UDP-N-acetylmuramoyl-tripeptide--D-alanyl-D-alanine ligase